MAEELQALLDRINEQGIQKAEGERRQLVSQAREDAQNIIDNANGKAENIVSEARAEAKLLVEKGRDSLRQAARDTMLSLRERLEEQMSTVVKQAVAEDVKPEALADFIGEMVEQHSPKGKKTVDIEAQVPEKIIDNVRKHLMARFGKNFGDKCKLTPLPEMGGGFTLSIDNKDVFYDFSDDALAEVLCTFLNPKLAEIVKPALASDKTDEQDNSDSENAEPAA